jgi:MFS family permease
VPPPAPAPSRTSLRALDWLNFCIADVQTGFGPFVAVYLTENRWTQVEIGSALSLGTLTALVGQLPAGALVDALPSKRSAAVLAILSITASALMLAIWPAQLPVLAAEMLHGLASCVLGPAVAAVSMALVGRAALGERLGRNARFAAVGNGAAAAVMGVLGYEISNRAVFWLTAALAVPGLILLRRIGRARLAPEAGQAEGPGAGWAELRRLLLDRRLVTFAGCAMLFHLSNAAMLPLAAGEVTTKQGGGVASLVIAACVVVPQIVVALISPWVGRSAQTLGRRPMLLLGWSMLPLRGALMALFPNPWALVALQSLSGVSAAVFGIMLPLVSADLTRGTNRFNVCMGMIGIGVFLGAAASTTLSGSVADTYGDTAAFLALALAGLAGTGLVWLALPETREGG